MLCGTLHRDHLTERDLFLCIQVFQIQYLCMFIINLNIFWDNQFKNNIQNHVKVHYNVIINLINLLKVYTLLICKYIFISKSKTINISCFTAKSTCALNAFNYLSHTIIKFCSWTGCKVCDCPLLILNNHKCMAHNSRTSFSS